MFTAQDKEFILNLVRRSIEKNLESGLELTVDYSTVPERLKENISCFVTLTIEDQLRGCVGHIQATQSLYLDVIENAIAAAFKDNRFAPLIADEFSKIKIEVSVLTKPMPLKFSSPDDLLKKLQPNIDGVIIKKGRKSATYLPQVWEELPDKKEFLSSLCLKAGLNADEWTRTGLSALTYRVEVIK